MVDDWKSYYMKYKDHKKEGISDWEQRMNYIKKWVDKNASVLDLGCGVGILSFLFENYTGIDINDVAIDFGKDHNINIIKMDCNKRFKFKNNEFDAVIALNLIEHVEDPIFFLKEIKRVLMPKSVAIFSTPNVNIIRKHIRPIKDPDHRYFWGVKSFSNLLKNNGFKVENVGCIGRFKNTLLCQTIMVLTKVKL